jgi:hypothetical protein
MRNDDLFTPIAANHTLRVQATGSASAAAALRGGASLRVHVTGDDPVFLAFGDANVVATLDNAIPFASGAIESIGRNSAWSHVSAITGGTSSNVSITVGNGE